MRRRSSRVPALLCLLALQAGCLAPGVRDVAAPAEPRPGVDRYRLVTGSARSVGGCRYGYRVYEPSGTGADAAANGVSGMETIAGGEAVTGRTDAVDEDDPDPSHDPTGTEPTAGVTVVLGHGFLRDQDTLVGLARALADAGLRTVTLDFCGMRPWNGYHERNARDMVALAARVSADRRSPDAGGVATGTRREGVIYVGFSAGALAAVLAGSEDPATLGVVTLDLVDQGDLALDAVAALDAPLVGLQGPPSGCNAQNNGRRVFAARPGSVLETLDGASHCEFESPTGALCELACGDDDADASDERARADIVRRVVAATLGLAWGTPVASAAGP